MSNITVVRRATMSDSAVDMYVTIQGKDKLHHKIGCKNGLPITEKVEGEAMRLSPSEVEQYSQLLKQNKEIN